MPLPVSIVIGTSIAVIGSGYAFKKFIYDPHIAPHLEGWIAAHRAAFTFPGASTRVAVAVPASAAIPVSGSGSGAGSGTGHVTPRAELRGVPSHGRSSARKDPHATVISLRRRSGRKGSDEMHELREALVDDSKVAPAPRRSRAGDEEFKGVYARIADDDDKGEAGGYGGAEEAEGDDWGRPSAYELKESVVLGGQSTLLGVNEKGLATRETRNGSRTQEQRKLSGPPQPTRKGSRGLIDLAHPRGGGDAEDAEVREVIFNYAPSTIGASGASTPLRQQTSASGAGTGAGGMIPPYSALGGGINPFLLGIAPDIHATPGDMPITLTFPGQAGSPGPVASDAGRALPDTFGLLDHAGPVPDTLGPESTTFSFLSLSQASSPEVPTSLLGSWTLGKAVASTPPSASESASAPPLSDFASRLHSPPTAGRGLGHGHGFDFGPRSSAEDEVVSLPETCTSGYEDAEYYSPETRSRAGSPARSPTRVVPAFPREWPFFNTDTNAEYGGGAGELGMVWADTRRGNGIGNDSGGGGGGGGAALRRGPLSVVSLSESEGWRSDDFEGETGV